MQTLPAEDLAELAGELGRAHAHAASAPEPGGRAVRVRAPRRAGAGRSARRAARCAAERSRSTSPSAACSRAWRTSPPTTSSCADLAPPRRPGAEELTAQLRERYPYLSEPPALADSSVLTRALEAARGPRPRLWVTLDARALDGAVTGTQVHILELIRALAHTRALRLRLLVRAERIDRETLELLRGPTRRPRSSRPRTSIPATPRSTVFHRPQQTFSPGDVALALRLGERFVLSQLDLIAYRNPGYFADADAWEDYRRASRHGMSAAERVVVFSDHTRRELLSDALVEEDAHQDRAARPRPPPPGRSADARRHSRRRGESLAAGFLLCLGTDFRHKNRVFALRLLARASRAARLARAASCSPARTSRTAPRSSSSTRCLEEQPELRESVVCAGPGQRGGEGWLIAPRRRGRLPVGVRGLRPGPVRVGAQRRPLRVRPAVLAGRGRRPSRRRRSFPGTPRQSAAAVHALLTDDDARARHVRRARRRRARPHLGRRGRGADGRDLPRGGAGAGARRRHAEPRCGRARTQAERRCTMPTAERLVREREQPQRMYEELNAEVGFGAEPDRPARLAARGASSARCSRSARARGEPAAVRRALPGRSQPRAPSIAPHIAACAAGGLSPPSPDVPAPRYTLQ